MVVDMAQFETGELRKMVLVLREKPVVLDTKSFLYMSFRHELKQGRYI